MEKNLVKFVADNSQPAPKKEHKTPVWEFPLEVAKEIKVQIEKYNNSIAIPVKAFNKEFGWKADKTRNRFLTMKLNQAMPLGNKYEWFVGTRRNKEFYVFAIIIRECL